MKIELSDKIPPKRMGQNNRWGEVYQSVVDNAQVYTVVSDVPLGDVNVMVSAVITNGRRNGIKIKSTRRRQANETSTVWFRVEPLCQP